MFNGGDENTANPYQMLFPAEITAVSSIMGRNVYEFTELSVDPDTGGLTEALSPRTGDFVTAPLFEVNDISVGVPTTGWVRYRGASGGFPCYDFAAPASPASGTTVIVREADGTPSVVASIIEFQQLDGFTVTNLGGGVAYIQKTDNLPVFSGVTFIGDTNAINLTDPLYAQDFSGTIRLLVHDAAALQAGVVNRADDQTLGRGNKTIQGKAIAQATGASGTYFQLDYISAGGTVTQLQQWENSFLDQGFRLHCEYSGSVSVVGAAELTIIPGVNSSGLEEHTFRFGNTTGSDPQKVNLQAMDESGTVYTGAWSVGGSGPTIAAGLVVAGSSFGSMASQDSDDVSITGGSITGGTIDGGTWS